MDKDECRLRLASVRFVWAEGRGLFCWDVVAVEELGSVKGTGEARHVERTNRYLSNKSENLNSK